MSTFRRNLSLHLGFLAVLSAAPRAANAQATSPEPPTQQREQPPERLQLQAPLPAQEAPQLQAPSQPPGPQYIPQQPQPAEQTQPQAYALPEFSTSRTDDLPLPEPRREYSGRTRVLFTMPYVGLNTGFGDSPVDKPYSMGVRLGAFLGLQMGPYVSFNGEASVDVPEHDVPSGATADELILGLTFSPLVHIGSPSLEFAIGPRIGYYFYDGSLWEDGTDSDYEARGLAYGLNVGAFFVPIRGTSLGTFLSATVHNMSNACRNGTCGGGIGGTDVVVALNVGWLVPRMCVRRDGFCP